MTIDFDDAMARSKDKPAFSNSTEWEMWAANWCERPCKVDANQDCPLIMIALLGRTPAEWLPQPADRYPSDAYHCVNFRGKDDPGDEPQPQPEPPDMDGLFDRPERVTRMLVQPQRSEVRT